MDDVSLFFLVLVAWSVVFMATRKVSVFPIIPVIPIVFLAIGYFVNSRSRWLGTALVAALHAALVLAARSHRGGGHDGGG